MKEVEILVKVNSQIKEVLEKLKNFKFEGIKDVHDIYYHNPSTKKCSPNEKNELTECLRIRQKDGKTYIT